MLLRDYQSLFSLTLADLQFEWILSLCMVLALGAVFAPLFILLGLQQGIVGNMLDELRRDPVSRLVIPRFPTRDPLNPDWQSKLTAQTEAVIYSPTSRLLLDIKGHNQPVNVLPTGSNDPLLKENRIDLANNPLSIVLSNRLAEKLDKKKGDVIELVLERHTSQNSLITHKFYLAGVLPQTAATDLKAWLPETTFREIYQWHQGKALPLLGLPGRGYLNPEYDGIITVLKKQPSATEFQRMLAGRLSFSQMPELLDSSSWITLPNEYVYLWRPLNSKVFQNDIPQLINRHHEMGYTIETAPFLADFRVELVSEGEKQALNVTVLPKPPQATPIQNKLQSFPRIWVSSQDNEHLFAALGEISFLSGPTTPQKVAFPVIIDVLPNIKPGHIALSEELAGKMNAARRQVADYDPASGEFVSQEDTNNYFFRAYAKSIDDIEQLVSFIREQGIEYGEEALREPVSKLAQVQNIRKLSDYMEKLYLLIVIVSGVSGIFAIAASVYAGVERKRRDLAYLQLLGLSRRVLLFFPYFKSLILVIGGILVALLAYMLFSISADLVFSEALNNSDSLTQLSWLHIVLLVTTIVITASCASLLAALAVNRIEVGEIIHE